MIRLLKRLCDDIHEIALVLTIYNQHGAVVRLSPDDRDLLANYRRYAPRVKKETV